MNRLSWEFKNQQENGSASLYIYGDIEQYKWIEDDVTAQEFARDLSALGDVDELEVRFNTNGGSVFAARSIASLLKSHSARVIGIVDGLAASSGTIITSACDELRIFPGAMMMVHLPLAGMCGYFNVPALQKHIDRLEAVKGAIVETYKSKTNKSEDELVSLMEKETWMTGREAVELGFADTLIEDADDINASLSGDKLIMNGVEFDTRNFKAFSKEKVPNLMKLQMGSGGVVNHVDSINMNEEEDEIVTIEQIKNGHPELYKQIKNEGAQEERNRIKDIKDMTRQGDESMADKAMFETGISARDYAVETLKADATKGSKFLSDRAEDVQDSNLDDVTGDTTPQNDEDIRNELADMIAGTTK